MNTRILITKKGIRILCSKRKLRSEIRKTICILLCFLLIFLALLPENTENTKLTGISKGRLIALLGISNVREYTKCRMLPPGIHYWYKTKNIYGETTYFFFQDKFSKEHGRFHLIPKKGRFIDKNDSAYYFPDSMKIPFQAGVKNNPNGETIFSFCSLENDSLPCFSHVTLEKDKDDNISELYFGYALKNIDAFIKCLESLK